MLGKVILSTLVALTSSAHAACSFDTTSFKGSLEVSKTDEYGFPTILSTPEDSLVQLFLTCDENTSATLRVLAPTRVKDGGPVLKTKGRSFLKYQGELYGNDKSVLISGGFESRPIEIGISIGNQKYILPASDKYLYEVILLLTMDVKADN